VYGDVDQARQVLQQGLRASISCLMLLTLVLLLLLLLLHVSSGVW
jgi:hypothetical protein